MTVAEFISMCTQIAEEYKTLYMWGTFGSVITPSLIEQKTRQYPSHYPDKKIATLTENAGAWAFDCVGLIKGILWGWSGKTGKNYGGAVYRSNAVPDATASGILSRCYGVSSDFSRIDAGEIVYKKGHMGVYLGGGKVAEATPSYSDGVQITNCGNIATAYPATKWEKHGYLPWIDYFSVGEKVKFRDGVEIEDVSTQDTPAGWRVTKVGEKITIDKPWGHSIFMVAVDPWQIERKK